ncbi:unnamed protein product [Vitrella brassicaformis CCMP3155]|uniref:TLDc domain-containing protein n=2 Tax=Vitrella brassicaformis TaxID=1169539 RepID=A0A0G4GS96_VITBC|nr:unnamed protein product [Vitrella brassicaformis CCMP3155]|eukprot:CEM33497.1 unnamed protein product [Vitrella brassicaformis CCMP3155]
MSEEALSARVAALQLAFEQHREKTQQEIRSIKDRHEQQQAALAQKAQESAGEARLRSRLESEIAARQALAQQVQEQRRYLVEEVSIDVRVEFDDEIKEVKETIEEVMAGVCYNLEQIAFHYGRNVPSSKGLKLMMVADQLCQLGKQFLRLSSLCGQYRFLREWLGGFMALKSMNLLYKSSRDGQKYPTFLDKTRGVPRPFILIRYGPSHLFGCTIDGPLTEPEDPQHYAFTPRPVSLYSISGAYDMPCEIPIPTDKPQVVGVVGREVTNHSASAVLISAWEVANLRLAFARPGTTVTPSASSMLVRKEHLPRGFQGPTTRDSPDGVYGTLAGVAYFSPTEVEVWALTP